MTQEVFEAPAKSTDDFHPYARFKPGEDVLCIRWEDVPLYQCQTIAPRYGAIVLYASMGFYVGLNITGLARYVRRYEQWLGFACISCLARRALKDADAYTGEGRQNLVKMLELLRATPEIPFWVRVPNPNPWRPLAIPHVG